MAVAPGPNTIPIAFPPGLNRSSTPIGVGQQWWDGHLVRWVQNRLRPVNGWERMDLPELSGGPVRALHTWIDSNGVVRLGILCETKLWVLEGSDVTGTGDLLRDVTPPGGITAPTPLTHGGYGNDKYGAGQTPPLNYPNIYGTGLRNLRPDERSVGEVWRLANWGDDLLAMASPDGRLLKWTPGPDIGGSQYGCRGRQRADRQQDFRGHGRAPRHALRHGRRGQPVRLVFPGEHHRLGLRLDSPTRRASIRSSRRAGSSMRSRPSTRPSSGPSKAPMRSPTRRCLSSTPTTISASSRRRSRPRPRWRIRAR
jgi:hypothetical protein